MHLQVRLRFTLHLACSVTAVYCPESPINTAPENDKYLKESINEKT